MTVAADRAVAVIIPALNEAGNVGPLVSDLRALGYANVIVVDNGSTDGTAEEGARAGARVVAEPRRGYGYACAAGLAATAGADVVAFMDGDGSFLPGELPLLVGPILSGHADMVVGSRASRGLSAGAMPIHQRLGNRLVASLLRLLYGLRVSDIGPYRAVRRDLLERMAMREMTFGWPAEMAVKAARMRARVMEVPVSYRRRLSGSSKVGGTVRGTLLAGYRMLAVALRYASLRGRR